MPKDLVQETRVAAMSAAQEIVFQDEPGLVVVIRRNDGGRYDVNLIIGGQMPFDQLRDAILGAIISLGKVGEQTGVMGPVLMPETR